MLLLVFNWMIQDVYKIKIRIDSVACSCFN